VEINTIFTIIWILAGFLFVLILVYIVMILVEFKKSARSISNMIKDTETQYTPLLTEIAGSTSSIKNIIARIDRISGLFLAKLDIMAEGSQKTREVVGRFIKSPFIESKSLLAGVKKAIDVLLRR